MNAPEAREAIKAALQWEICGLCEHKSCMPEEGPWIDNPDPCAALQSHAPAPAEALGAAILQLAQGGTKK